MIDVRLTLLVQTAAADVGHAEDRLEVEVSLYGEVPVVSGRIVEITALRGDGERQGVDRCPAGIIDVAVGNVSRRLERRVASQEDGIADAQAGEKLAAAGADDGFIVQLIGDAQARLELTPLDVREIVGVGAAAMEIVEGAGSGFGEAAFA